MLLLKDLNSLLNYVGNHYKNFLKKKE